jgi:hypothetical protein
MIALTTLPMSAAAGYSLIYLLGGGGLLSLQKQVFASLLEVPMTINVEDCKNGQQENRKHPL